MVWVIDDLAEAALGPWGLAVAVGVGLVSAARQRKAVATADAPAGAWAAGGLGSAATLADGVKDRVQTALAEAGEYWRDLYAEAQHEWEQGRSGSTPSAGATATAPAVTKATRRAPSAKGKRVRGTNGRYVKEQG